MSRKATYYRSASFAALVVGSSIALLTGAQADTLTFGPGNNTGTVFFGAPSGPFFANWVGQSGPASFDSLSGTFTASSMFLSAPSPGSQTASGAIGNFTASFPAPCVTCAGDSLTGSVSFPPTSFLGGVGSLTGSLTVTAISGDPTFVSNFGGVGGMDNFSWQVAIPAPGSFPDNTFISIPAPGIGTISPVPLPGAIYLFGSVFGGAFWLSRRKRSAVSTLGAA
jgi:hypothetical protein